MIAQLLQVGNICSITLPSSYKFDSRLSDNMLKHVLVVWVGVDGGTNKHTVLLVLLNGGGLFNDRWQVQVLDELRILCDSLKKEQYDDGHCVIDHCRGNITIGALTNTRYDPFLICREVYSESILNVGQVRVTGTIYQSMITTNSRRLWVQDYRG